MRMVNCRFLTKTLLFFHLLLLSQFSNGQSLATERFDSLPGTLHQYAGSTTGWFSNWLNQNDYTGADGYSISNVSPMTHPEAVGVGNYCVGGGDFTSTGRYFDVGGTFADFEDANGRIGVGTIYFTFLIRKDEDNDTPIEIIFADDPGSAWAINQELIKVGYFGASSNSGGQRFWSVAAFNETAVDLSATEITIGQTYQIIVEIDFDATTTINMWVDPSGGSPDLMNPDATVSSNQDLGFWNLILHFNAVGTGHGSFDEFVFSEDLGIVLPVEYSEIRAVAKTDFVDLHWITATELLNEKFLIERSMEGKNWQVIGEREGSGTTSEPKAYSFRDYQPQVGLNFYRLTQVDFDGKRESSKVFKAIFGELEGLKTRTFHKAESIEFVFNKDLDEVSVYDLAGKLVQHRMIGARRFSISRRDRKGTVYFIRARSSDEVWSSKVLSK